MKVDIHVVTIESPDSKTPVSWAAPTKMDVAIGLLDNYADDDDEFTQFCLEMDPLLSQEAGLHAMPLDQLIQRLEAHYSLTIQHQVNEVEVALPVVDPTAHVDLVARRVWERPRNADVDRAGWDDLDALGKQEFKQAIVLVLYDTLEALVEQGVIGGIARG